MEGRNWEQWIGYLAGKISKQCIENTAWVLLTACRKMQKEREIDEVIVKQNETELGRYRKFSAYWYYKKWENSCSFFSLFSLVLLFSLGVEENTKCIVSQPFAKLMVASHGLNHWSQQKPGTGKHYWKRHCSLKERGQRKDRMKEATGFLWTRRTKPWSYLAATCANFQEKGKLTPKHSDIIQAATPTTELKGRGYPEEPWRWHCHLHGPGERSMQLKRITALRSNGS